MDTRDGFVCDRCGKKAMGHGMSYFNTEECCTPCLRKEREHPDFQKAQDAEEDQVRSGNYNFAGIGKPPGL